MALGVASALLMGVAVAGAEDSNSEVDALRREVRELRQREEESRARMVELERVMEEMRRAIGATSQPTAADVAQQSVPAPGVAGSASAAEDALDQALAATPPVANASVAGVGAGVGAGGKAADLWSAPLGSSGATARLMDMSVVTLVAGGGSSVGNEELGQLQLGGHDPNQNGFTLQQAEFSMSGAVDPWFTGEMHVVGTVNGVELEEGFLTTSSLPYGLQVEAGYSLTEFGLINPLHAHAWEWIDQPVINSRLFGGEGTRSPGARASWLLPTPFFSELHVGVQDANAGEFTPSFIGEDGVGGRPNLEHDVRNFGDVLWLVRSNSSWDLNAQTALMLGASTLYGPNATGPDGRTWIHGIDAKLRWRAVNNFRGWPFVIWQTEAMVRNDKVDGYVAASAPASTAVDFPNDLPAGSLVDGGFYSQVLYGFRYGWAVGFRGEYAAGRGQSVDDSLLSARSGDSLRDDRLRLSPLLAWYPSEFSRLRLQYNYDHADFLANGGDAHTVWVSIEVLYGRHAAHKY